MKFNMFKLNIFVVSSSYFNIYLKLIWPTLSYDFWKWLKYWGVSNRIWSLTLSVVINKTVLKGNHGFTRSIITEFWKSARMLIGINSLLRGHHYDTTLNTGWIWSICGKFQYTNVLVISTVKGKDLWSMVNCNYLRIMALNRIAMWIKLIDIIDLLYFTSLERTL